MPLIAAGGTGARAEIGAAAVAIALSLTSLGVVAGPLVLPDPLEVSADVALEVDGTAQVAAAQLQIDDSGALVSAMPPPAALLATRGDLVALAQRLAGPHVERWLVLDVAYAPAASPLVPAGRPFRCMDLACDQVQPLPLPDMADGIGVAALAFDVDDSTVLLALDAGGEVGGQAFPGGVVLACDVASCNVEAGPGQFPDGPRVDALAVLDDGRWLVGFDSGGEVSGLAFRDEDLLVFDPVAGSFGLALAPAAADDQWHAANLDAVSVPLALPDALFSDGFEDG